MRLGALLPNAGKAGDDIVTGFALDHRKVAPGTIFGAFQGARVNGEDYIAAAIAAGAVCEGPPGMRTDTFYGAYFRDPDGNKICVFKMG